MRMTFAQRSLLDHYIDHVTRSVPDRRRSRGHGIPVSAALLGLAALVAALAWMPW